MILYNENIIKIGLIPMYDIILSLDLARYTVYFAISGVMVIGWTDAWVFECGKEVEDEGVGHEQLNYDIEIADIVHMRENGYCVH